MIKLDEERSVRVSYNLGEDNLLMFFQLHQFM
jgi:hypothetical protein